jgi:FkbM family methyltransferase
VKLFKKSEQMFGYKPSFATRLLRAVAKVSSKCLVLSGGNRWSNEFLQQIEPICETNADGQAYRFATGNGRLLWRAKTFRTEEPLIFEWARSFGPDDVVLDVGANAGLYSVLFAKHSSLVFSCELDPLNAAEIRRNAVLNEVVDRVVVLPFACGARHGLSSVHFRDLSSGDALQSMGRPSPFATRLGKLPYVAPTVAVNLDQFWREAAFPQVSHIKIDVDGNEAEVFPGVRDLCKGARSIYLEDSGDSYTRQMLEELKGMGFQESSCSAISAGSSPGASSSLGFNRVLRRS